VAVIEGGEVSFARGFDTRHPDRDELVEAEASDAQQEPPPE